MPFKQNLFSSKKTIKAYYEGLRDGAKRYAHGSTLKHLLQQIDQEEQDQLEPIEHCIIERQAV